MKCDTLADRAALADEWKLSICSCSVIRFEPASLQDFLRSDYSVRGHAMRQAVVCKSASQEGRYTPILQSISNLKLKTFYSAEDGLEYFWNNSHDIQLVVFQRDLNHFEELIQTTNDWPGVKFFLQKSEMTSPGRGPRNLTFIEKDATTEELTVLFS